MSKEIHNSVELSQTEVKPDDVKTDGVKTDGSLDHVDTVRYPDVTGDTSLTKGIIAGDDEVSVHPTSEFTARGGEPA